MLRSIHWSLESDVSFRPETSITIFFKFSLTSLFILHFFLSSFLCIYLFLHFLPPLPPFCTSQNVLWGSCLDLHRFLSAYVSFRPEVSPSGVITPKTLSPTSLNTKFALPHSLVAISLPRTSGPEKQQLIFVTELWCLSSYTYGPVGIQLTFGQFGTTCW